MRARRTRTNVGSAAGVLSRTDRLNVPARTENARFQPYNDRACRLAPGGRCVRPAERRAQLGVSAPMACAIAAATWCATSPAFSAPTVRRPGEQNRSGPMVGSAVRRKTRHRLRKAASIFTHSAHKLCVSRVAARTYARARSHGSDTATAQGDIQPRVRSAGCAAGSDRPRSFCAGYGRRCAGNVCHRDASRPRPVS